jgi:endonuclease V-like protein UPF0215 family
MRSLEEVVRLNKNIRVIGFDDAPFAHIRDSAVKISGIVCSNTRFEGMLWGEIKKDGQDATDTIIQLLKTSKFFDQVNIVLTDGIAVGGFNIIDLERLSAELGKPCVAVMRKYPNLQSIDNALKNFPDYQDRIALIEKAGEIFTQEPFYFQVKGCSPTTASQVLNQLTDNGNVPEALRLAHLIGSAVITGQSSNRA